MVYDLFYKFHPKILQTFAMSAVENWLLLKQLKAAKATVITVRINRSVFYILNVSLFISLLSTSV